MGESGTKEPQTETSKPQSLFGIDPRSLATCRIAIGSLLLVDLSVRASDLKVMYGEDGLIPIDAVRKSFGGAWRWSLYWLDSSLQFHAALFLVAAILAFALLVGYRTRLATIGSWVLLASLHTRAPMVNNGGDTLLLLLLFWCMFLPLGQVWSIDAWRHPPACRGREVLSVGTIAILLQVCMVYWCTALFKFDQNWNAGHGVQNALMWGGYNRPLGDWLLGYPGLMQALSLAAVWLEMIGPFLLFIPWRTAYFRMFIIMAFVGLHAGIELSMHVGLFSYVSIAAWTLFLPSIFWNAAIWNPIRRWFRFDGTVMGEAETADTLQPASMRRGKAAMLVDIFCAACLGYVILHNLLGLVERRRDSSARDGWQMPTAVENAGRTLRLRQKWAMFASPLRFSVWYAARAETADARVIDVLRDGQPMDYTPPLHQAAVHPNHRWRKYCQNIGLTKSLIPFHQIYADYLLQEWNASHATDQQIRILELLCFYQTVADGDAGDDFQMVSIATATSADVMPEHRIPFGEPWMKEKGAASAETSSL